MAPSGAFSGFTGKTLYTPVPNPVFGPILEQIQDLAELKVTLRGLWLFHRKRDFGRISGRPLAHKRPQVRWQ